MPELIDLDELIAAPKQVRLGGEIYTLPGELPVPLYLRLRAEEQAVLEAQAEGEEVDQDRRVEDLNNLLLDLFRVHQPDIEVLPAGLVQLFTIIPRVYAAAPELDEEAGEAAPKAKSRPGSKRTRTQSTIKSRS